MTVAGEAVSAEVPEPEVLEASGAGAFLRKSKLTPGALTDL
jgi:hypothetical protein